jgi:hypothetical protein
VPFDYIVGGSPGGGHVPGSVTARCVRCAAAVMIAPSGQRLRAARDLQPLCMPCAEADGQGPIMDRVQPLTLDQVLEIVAFYTGRP